MRYGIGRAVVAEAAGTAIASIGAPISVVIRAIAGGHSSAAITIVVRYRDSSALYDTVVCRGDYRITHRGWCDCGVTQANCRRRSRH